MKNLPEIFSSWALMQVLHALYMVGVLDFLKKNVNTEYTTSVLAQILHVHNPTVLQEMLKLVSILEDSIIYSADGVNFRAGQILVKDDVFWNVLLFSFAYASTFTHVGALATGRAHYGKDVMRSLEHLGESSELHNKVVWPVMIRELRKREACTIVDIGCGSGGLLRKIREELPGVGLVGVEVDAVHAATLQKLHRTEKNAGELQFIQGDAASPADWSSQVAEKRYVNTVLIAVTVLHEFLNKGTGYVEALIRLYSQQFPGAAFLVCEYNGFSFEELKITPRTLRSYASVYQFVHPLTEQGVPMGTQEWVRLFRRSGVAVQAVHACKNNLTLYVLQL